MAGLVAAAARGRQGGRRPVVTPGKLERARALLAQGLNVREAATKAENWENRALRRPRECEIAMKSSRPARRF
jgi:hypothetical protein